MDMDLWDAIFAIIAMIVKTIGPIGEDIQKSLEPLMLGPIQFLQAYADPSYRIYAGLFGFLSLAAAFFLKGVSGSAAANLAKLGILSLAIAFFWEEVFTPIGLIGIILLALGLMGVKWFVVVAGSALLIYKYMIPPP